MHRTMNRTLVDFLLISVVVFLLALIVVYGLFERSIQSMEDQNATQTLQNLSDNLSAYLNDVTQDLQLLANEQLVMGWNDMTNAEKYQGQNSLRTILNSFINFKNGVIGVKLHSRGHSGLYSSNNVKTVSDVGLRMAYQSMVSAERLDENPGGVRLTAVVRRDGQALFGVAVPIYSSLILFTDQTYEGCLLAVCDFSLMKELLAGGSLPFLIVEENQVLVSNADPARWPSLLADDRMLWHQHGGAGWRVGVLPHSSADNVQVGMLRTFCILLTVLLLFVQTLLLFSLRAKITKPIQSIAKQTRRIGKGLLSIGPAEGSYDELDMLTACINDMVARVEELSHQAANAENRYLQERVMFLQTQINPHFLYNNLECVRGMASMGDVDGVCSIVSSIAWIYRYGVEQSACTTLREELECLRQFMRIIALRYDNAFQLHIQQDDMLLEESMPRMVLQPLAENAITHGFLHTRRRSGSLYVSMFMRDGALVVELTDDGAGIPEDTLRRLNNREGVTDVLRPHIGVSNIQNRLALLGQPGSGLTLANRPGGGTAATLCMIGLSIKKA